MRIFLILSGITLLSISAFALPVVIDPGHGGFDSGIKSAQIDEKDFTLMLSNEIVSVLNEANQQAILLRQTSRYLSFNERAMVIEKTRAKAFLSIHGSKTGYSVYICRFPKDDPAPKEKYSLWFRQKNYIKQSKALAQSIALSLKEEFNQKVSIREIPLSVLSPISAPAVLVEVPITNNKKIIKRTAFAIAKGVSDYETE